MCSINVAEIHSVHNICFEDGFLIRFFKRLLNIDVNIGTPKSYIVDGIEYKNLIIQKGLTDLFFTKLSRTFKLRNIFFFNGMNKLNKKLRPLVKDTVDSSFIMSHWLYPSAYFAMKLSQLCGIPYGITFHGSDINSNADYWGRFLASKKVVEGSFINFFVSEKLLHTAEQRFDLNLNTRISPNSISSAESLTLTQVKNERIYDVIYAGNLLYIKGADRLFDIISKVDLRTPSDLKFIIVGSGKYLDYLKKKFNCTNIDITFTGQVDRKQCQTFISQSKLFVLPSRNEGLPLVAIESSLLKTMVAATNVGGCSEVIHSDYLVENDDGCIENMSRLVSDLLQKGSSVYKFKEIEPLDSTVKNDINYIIKKMNNEQ
jgi:glycosyltransferase involved in cell wall biosynthesis